MNRYAYVRNNPLRYIDPTGEAIQLLGGTEEEREAELAAVRDSLVNSKVADRLTITSDDDGQFFVGIEGKYIITDDIDAAGGGTVNLEGVTAMAIFGLRF